MLGSKKLNDQQLVDAIKNGDKDAMVQLYKDNGSSIRNYVLKNNGNSDDAEDVLQDTCIALWEKIQNNQIELRAKLSTLAFAIARNQWLKRLNKLSKSVQIDGINTEKMSAHTDSFQFDDKKKVQEVLGLIGEKCKELLTLFYFDGFDMNTIAEKMNYNNADTVKAKKHQCFKSLQEQFLKKYSRQDFI